MENEIIIYNTEEVAKILGCSLPTARIIMNRRDFPLLRIGKNLKVYKTAFENWLNNPKSDIDLH